MSEQPKRFVYVLENLKATARHYVGLTSNVPRRLAAHNAGTSLYSARYRPWRLRVAIEFADASGAAAFEKHLKTPSGRAFAKRHF